MSAPPFRALVEQHASEIVRTLYAAVLHREPDEDGLETHTAALRATGDLGYIVTAMTDSRESWNCMLAHRADEVVTAAYRALLGRAPDPEGLRYHAARVSSNEGLEELMSVLINSEEFQARAVRALSTSAGPLALGTDPTGRLVPEFSASDLLEEKLVFLHIPKTGGTTLHNYLVTQFEAPEICPERFNGLRYYPAGELARYRLFSGHFDLPSVRLIAGKKRIITFLREPVARLISLYYFQKAHRPEVAEQDDLHLAQLAHRCSIAEFFAHDEVRTHPAINNAMMRVLTDRIEGPRWEAEASPIDASNDVNSLPLAIRELESLDAFGILERYDESLQLICRTVGLMPPAAIEKKQVTDVIANEEPSLRPVDKEEITDEIRACISELVTMDSQLYKHAYGIFNRRIRSLEAEDSATCAKADVV